MTMKITAHPRLRLARLSFELVAFTGLILFVLEAPLGMTFRLSEPSVKASFVSEPLIPHGSMVPPPEISAISTFIMDIDSGVVLFANNPIHRQSPASVTKIMTALVAMDTYEDGTVLTVMNGDKALGNKANLVSNDQLVSSDMLFALLVPSGNDAAVTLAENYPGGYSKFIDKMNQKTEALGLKNTHFSNVSGVEGVNHYSSAYDMAIIALEALKRSSFRNIVSTKDVVIKSLKDHLYPLESTNKLLDKPGFYGVKTGWTPEAGECLVTLAEKDGHPIIISLFGSKDRFGETEKMFDWVYDNYTWN